SLRLLHSPLGTRSASPSNIPCGTASLREGMSFLPLNLNKARSFNVGVDRRSSNLLQAQHQLTDFRRQINNGRLLPRPELPPHSLPVRLPRPGLCATFLQLCEALVPLRSR